MPSHFTKVAVFVALGVSLASCSGQKGAETPSAVATQGAAGGGAAKGGGGGGGGRRGAGGPVPVSTAKVQTKSVPVTIPAVGTAEALQTVQIRAQVTGQLSAMHFAEGQDVKKGQLLFTIDPRPFQAALSQAEAVLARDTATANNAERQKATYEDLFKRGLIPRDQYETQRASTTRSQATLAADRAAVENAKLNLAVHAASPRRCPAGPARSRVHAGDLVRANDTTPMVVINQVSPIYVIVLGARAVSRRHPPLPGAEAAARSIARGQVVGRAGRAGSGAARAAEPGCDKLAPGQGGDRTGRRRARGGTGRVTFIDNAVDPTTGTIKLKGTFDNADHGLWPGLFVEVTLQLTTDARTRSSCPAAAVQPSAVGPVRLRREAPIARWRSGRSPSARQTGEEMVIADGAEGRRGSRDRRPAAAHAGRAGVDRRTR